jgi:hypothetical protein
MKKTLFAFMALLFVMGEAAHAQSKKMVIPKLKGPEPIVLDCKPLKQGTFKTTLDGKVTIMKREGNIETDYLDGSKVPAVYTIKWKNDCTLVLTPTPETYKTHPEIRKGAVFTMETFMKNTSSYTQVVSANYTAAKYNIEVYKIK